MIKFGPDNLVEAMELGMSPLKHFIIFGLFPHLINYSSCNFSFALQAKKLPNS